MQATINKTKDHHHALSKAKIQLMARSDSAFFTTVCFSLKHAWNDDIRTAETDGRTIWFNPAFFMSLSVEEQVFLLLHESMHVAYLHMSRAANHPNKQKANMAMDYVINLQLVERGFKMPACGLLDKQYAGMCWEEVYKLLPDNPPTPMGGFGEDLIYGDGDDSDGSTSSELAKEVQDILVRASIQSKMAGDKPGTIPGDIQIAIDKLVDPKLPWYKILAKYLHAFAKNDYSFRRPARRFFPKWHLPSMWSENLCDLAIAVDASGSVSDADFQVFVNEVSGILRMMKPETMTLLVFDTDIRSETKIKSVKELLGITFTGRGGTLISPVLEWANKTRPQLLLVFSDGEFRIPDIKAKSETVWVIHNNPSWKAPFGKTIHYII